MVTEKPDKEKSADEVFDMLATGATGSQTEYRYGVEVSRRQFKLSEQSAAAAQSSATAARASARYSLWAMVAAFIAAGVALAALFK